MLRIFRSRRDRNEQDSAVGLLRFYSDKNDEYWEVIDTTLPLGDCFEFGAVAGIADGPEEAALDCFRRFGGSREELYKLVGDGFQEIVCEDLPGFRILDLRSEFYLRSLTTTSHEEFEFGLHARSADVFVELFVRNGEVAEMHIDRGCCDV